MKSNGSATVLILSFCLLAAVCIPLTAQDQQAEQQIRVQQRLTDVIVRDGDGVFVKGLTRDNFRLLVNGRPVEVRYLEEFNALSPESEEVKRYMVEFKQAKAEGLELPLPPTPPRAVVLVFDCFNMGIFSTKDAKETARVLMEQVLLPYDTVIVYQYTGGMRHVAGPTSDRETIAQAIDSAIRPASGPYYRPSQDELMTPTRRENFSRVSVDNFQKRLMFFNFLAALRNLNVTMAAVPGRKSYLVFSDGPNLYNALDAASADAEAFMRGDRDAADRTAPSAGGLEDDVLFEPDPVIGNVSEEIDRARVAFVDVAGYDAAFDLQGYLDTTNTTFYTIRRGHIQPEWMLATDVDTTQPKWIVPAPGPGARIGAVSSGDDQWNSDIMQRVNNMQDQRLEVLRDMARLTNGKFYDAGYEERKLMDDLKDEIGNYYLLGFNVPEEVQGKYYDLKIEVTGLPAEVSDATVKHREGFYAGPARAEPAATASVEKKLLAAEPPSELGMVTRFIQMPFEQNTGAFYYFEVPTDKLPVPDGSPLKLEKIISVEDGTGRLRFRRHDIYTHPAGEPLPDTLWFLENVPLVPEGSTVSLVIREPESGAYGGVRRGLRTVSAGESTLTLTEPFFLQQQAPGNIGSWPAEEVKDNEGLVEPLSFTGLRLPGKPNAKNEFAQGEFATIFFMLGDLPEGFMPSADSLTVEYSIDHAGTQYYLMQANQRIQLLRSSNALAYMADVPVGLAQQETGMIDIAIKGIVEGEQLFTQIPFKLRDFSFETARQYLDDPHIIPVER